MCKQCFVFMVAVWTLAGSFGAARADTPLNAPAPEMAEQPSDDEAGPTAAEPATDDSSSDSSTEDTDKSSRSDTDRPGPSRPAAATPSGSGAWRMPSRRFRTGKGWFLGASVGIGSVTYSENALSDDSDTATFLELRLGGMLSQRFAMSAEFWTDGHREEFDESRATAQNCLGVAMTYWATPHLWFRAGLGASRLTTYRFGVSDRELASWAYMLGTGYELVSRNSLSVDLSVRLLSSTYEFFDFDFIQSASRSALSLHVGVNWY